MAGLFTRMLFDSCVLSTPPNLLENKIWYARKFVTFYIKMLERVFWCTCQRKWVVYGNGYARHAICRCASVSSIFDVHNNLILNVFFIFDAIFKSFSIRVRSNTITGDVCLPLVVKIARVGRIGGNNSRTYIVFQQNTVRLMVSFSWNVPYIVLHFEMETV